MASVDGIQRTGQRSAGQQTSSNRSPGRQRGKQLMSGPWRAAGIILAIIALLVIIWCSWLGPTVQLKPWRYQAVFLTNGQVYFGKLSNVAGKYVVVKDIYYLQSNNQTDADVDQTAMANDTQLIKLGEELHGPYDKMVVSRDQVLFWENLKADGQVAKAIDNYQESGTGQSSTDSSNPTSVEPPLDASDASSDKKKD